MSKSRSNQQVQSRRPEAKAKAKVSRDKQAKLNFFKRGKLMLVDFNKVDKVNIPHEEGEWIGIRSLTGVEMDESSNVATSRMLEQYGESLGDIMASRNGIDQSTRTPDRKQAYDSRTLLKYAIKSWSYEQPVTADNIELLDGMTRDWIWEEVVNRNTRPLNR